MAGPALADPSRAKAAPLGLGLGLGDDDLARHPSSVRVSDAKNWSVVATTSPWIWASEVVGEDEELVPSSESLRSAEAFFDKHGPGASFITPEEMGYELPSGDVPEVAIAGRSNVGKSTLLAALLKRPGLVRTSKTPGRTQTINFFALGPSLQTPALHLIDLPG